MRPPTPPAAVVRAAEHAGADPAQLRRLSSGTSNSVWSVAQPPLVLTAYGEHHDLAALTVRLRVAAALGARLPFVRLASGGLLLVGPRRRPVSVWERLDLLPVDPDWERVGAVLAGLHALPLGEVPGAGELPDLLDLGASHGQVAALRADRLLSVRGAAVLHAVVDRLADELRAVPAQRAVVHGDLHAPNVLSTADGPYLCDVDELGRAHPWWDLAFLLDPGRRPGLSRERRDALLAGYGAPAPPADLVLALSRASHLRRTLRELRWGPGGPEGAAWNRLRVAAWAANLRDWSTPLHPVFCLSRGQQAALLARPLRAPTT